MLRLTLLAALLALSSCTTNNVTNVTVLARDGGSDAGKHKDDAGAEDANQAVDAADVPAMDSGREPRDSSQELLDAAEGGLDADTDSSVGRPCSDADHDGVCDADDDCPIGSDEDTDADGFADLCDQIIWSSERDFDADCYTVEVTSNLHPYDGCIDKTPATAPSLQNSSLDRSFGANSALVKQLRKCLSGGPETMNAWYSCGGGHFGTAASSIDLTGKHVTRVRYQNTVGYSPKGSPDPTPVWIRWEVRGY